MDDDNVERLLSEAARRALRYYRMVAYRPAIRRNHHPAIAERSRAASPKSEFYNVPTIFQSS
jgi:hypothetical protein